MTCEEKNKKCGYKNQIWERLIAEGVTGNQNLRI